MNKAHTLTIVALALAIGLLVGPALSSRAASDEKAGKVAAAQETGASAKGALRTSGSAQIRVQPDRASIRFGVQTFGETPRGVQAENARIVERVLQAIRDQRIEAKDIATDHFSVRPEYDYPMRGKRSLVGYWSDNGVQVTLRDVTQLSSVLIAALEAGATSVDDLTFSTTRLRELRDEARALAVQAALEKAEALGSAAKIRTGAVTDIEESSASYYNGYWNRGGQWVNQVQNVIQEAAASSVLPLMEEGEFSLGQIVVQASVSASVEVE